MDCVIDFRIEEIDGSLYRSVRIHRARFPCSDTRWHPMEIMANGKIVIQPAIMTMDKDMFPTLRKRVEDET